jgi:predicted nucleic acid-binding protein
MKGPDIRLLYDWVMQWPTETLYTTVITEAELLSGIAMLPVGRKREELAVACLQVFQKFQGRILPFDREAAEHYGALAVTRRKAGRLVGTFDLLIAAIARRHGATVVTRDYAGFAASGVQLMNPWVPG